MTEYQLVSLWSKARQHVIISQLGPIFLLIVTVALLANGLGHAGVAVKLATAGILLASGILGAAVQVSSANEAMSIAEELRVLDTGSAISRRIIQQAGYANIVRFVTPTIFALIFIAILVALAFPGPLESVFLGRMPFN